MLRILQMQKIALLLLTFCLSGDLFSQSNPQYPTVLVDLSKTPVYLNEVFQNCPEYTTQEHLDRANATLGRVVFHQVPLGEYSECPLLSSAVKKNKCNPNLEYSLNSFDPLNFNTLKYVLKYSDTESNYYRVDGHDYIIEIKPKN